jgi:hypothetical protein
LCAAVPAARLEPMVTIRLLAPLLALVLGPGAVPATPAG